MKDVQNISFWWKEFEASAPEPAQFGRERLHGQVAYFATIRKDNLPRLHPVTPFISKGHLYVFMEPKSLKARDLERGSAYGMHSGVADNDGSNGEFQIVGYADRVRDAGVWQHAAASDPFKPEPHYTLFELGITEALSTVYRNDAPVRTKWKAVAP